MIHFFRRIRQRLLSDGKASKYLLYAIGEIALVMIGILLALQVNNWNENKKVRQQELYYLSGLHEEMIENKNRIEIMFQFQKAQLDRAKLLLKVVDGDTIVHHLQDLHIAVMHVGWAVNPVVDDVLWSELINTGKLGFIQNNELRSSIAQFHSQAKRYIVYEKEWGAVNLQYREQTNHVFPPRLRLAIGEILGYYEVTGKLKDALLSQEQIVKKLNANESIGGWISDIIINRSVSMAVTNDLLEACDEVLNILKQELEIKQS